MSEINMSEPKEPVLYQFRVVLQSISPLIWRRLLVSSDNTIADLHYILQIAFGWSNDHLHQFLIHGKQYGIPRIGGNSFRDDPQNIKLSSFDFRLGEKFLYEYDFYDDWQHLIRVEAILPIEPTQAYPKCIGGNRAAPPEDCGGVTAYQELRQKYSVWYITERLMEILQDEDPREHLEEIFALRRWLTIDKLDRREVNRRLQQYALKDPSWQYE